VKIEAGVLQDFVRDIFIGAEVLGGRGGADRQVSRLGEPLGTRQPWRGACARYVHSKLDGNIHGDQKVDLLVGHAGSSRSSTARPAMTDGDAAGGADRHRQVQCSRDCRRWPCVNAGHLGRVGDWAEMASAAKLVSQFISSTPPAASWSRPMAGSNVGSPPRPIASAFRARARTRSFRFRDVGRGRRQGDGGEPGRQADPGRRAHHG